MKLSKYLAKPGSRAGLTKRDPGDKSEVPAKKEERLRLLSQSAERLDELQDLLYAQRRHKLLVVLQGMDTAGKDGTIRHVFGAVDPLGVRAIGFRAPVGEELDHDYLWRVHRQVPGKGEIVIFNRSHYEDVLIVRVRGWIDMAECRRRYQHISDFERMLAESGTTILKFFLFISREEQRARLQERIDDPTKRWKFNPGDLAERKLWEDYMDAYKDAVEATSKEWPPWYIVPADSKSTRNLIVSSVLIDTLEGLGMRYPEPTEKLEGIVVE